ncbi:MAG: hypothetical protein ABIO50_03970 [Nitrosospira sp.]|jgi:hypothetical protein
MTARQVARQFCRLREVHSLVYGRRAQVAKWPRTDRQHSRRLAEPPNELSGLKGNDEAACYLPHPLA